MNLASTIRERRVHPSIEIVGETVRPVAAKWFDGLIHETDNLQLVLKNVGRKALTDVWVYLYYLDAEGNELGHEFDITHDPVLPDTDARVSLMLTPPDEYACATLEIRAEQTEKGKSMKLTVLMWVVIAVMFLVREFGR